MDQDNNSLIVKDLFVNALYFDFFHDNTNTNQIYVNVKFYKYTEENDDE
jgi:hypothetical protein